MTNEMRFCGACGADHSLYSEPTKSIGTKPPPPPEKNRFRVGTFAIILGALIVIGLLTDNASKPSSPSAATKPEPIDAKDVLLKQAKLKYTWTREGFGSVMTANFTVTNPTGIAFKDFEITCRHTAASGTEIDSNVRTIYEVVAANSTWTKQNFDMGFIHSQVQRSSCAITDLVPLQ